MQRITTEIEQIKYCGVYSAKCLKVVFNLDNDFVNASIQPVIIHKSGQGKSVKYYICRFDNRQTVIQAKLQSNFLHQYQLILTDDTPITPNDKVHSERVNSRIKYWTFINGVRTEIISKNTYKQRLLNEQASQAVSLFFKSPTRTKRAYELTLDTSEKAKISKISRSDNNIESRKLAMSSRFFNFNNLNDRFWEVDVKLSPEELHFYHTEQAKNSGVVTVRENPDLSFRLTIDRLRTL